MKEGGSNHQHNNMIDAQQNMSSPVEDDGQVGQNDYYHHDQQQLLECGTSLVEDEFHHIKHDDDNDNNHNHCNDDHSSLNINTMNGIDSSHNDNLVMMNRLSSSYKAVSSSLDDEPKSIESLRSWIYADLIQERKHKSDPMTMFQSPFEKSHQQSSPQSNRCNGCYQVPLIYCDQTASNRALDSIEHYINDVCLPWYGNTHTNTSRTGSQCTAFVAESRQIIAEEYNAKITGKASLDCILFT
jgi:hypothetical protein